MGLEKEEEDHTPSRDQQIGNYTLLEKLGAGGIGEVWKARDRRLNRVVALKFIFKEREGSSTNRDLLREARAASALNHPNIITIFEVGESDDSMYLAMEYVQGETLRTRMSRSALSASEAAEITRQVADGLAAAHREGILHRDLKPENIMIRADGIVKIVDFGLAKVMPWAQEDDAATVSAATQSGQLLGTFTYMSPEQARGQEATPASDVFSLGIILYELLCGKHPFRGPTVLDTLNAIIGKEPPPCPASSDVVARALRKNAAERYASASELAAALRGASPTPDTRSKKFTKLASAGVLTSGVVVALLLLVVALAYLRSRPPAAPVVHSVAIMNLRTPADDPRAAPLTEGLPEELGGALSQMGFQVAAQSSVQKLSAAVADDPRGAGARLGVDAVLAGTVRSYGSRYKIHVELVSARTGFQVWSETFTVDAEDILTGEKATAVEIATALKTALAPK